MEGIKVLGSGVEDLVFYFIGDTNSEGFVLNNQDVLSQELFSESLNLIQQSIEGKIILIFESINANRFTNQLVLHENAKEKLIVVSSTTENQTPHYLTQESISFSNIFWTEIIKGGDTGATLGEAFSFAKKEMDYYYYPSQTPFIDANGDNKMSRSDKAIVDKYYIGYGAMQAYNGPIIVSSVSPEIYLTGETEATFTATVIPSRLVERVFGIIHPPVKTKAYFENIPRFELTFNKKDKQFTGRYNGFERYGSYKVSIIAKSKHNTTSTSVNTNVIQTIGPDFYENDDILSRASLIIIDNQVPNKHTFHSKNDIDWFMFYALENETYEFIHDLDERIDFQINLYAKDGIQIIREENYNNTFFWPNSNTKIESGIYYLNFQPIGISEGQVVDYNFNINKSKNEAPDLEAGIQGNVYDKETRFPVSRALIRMNTLSALSDSTMSPNYQLFGVEENITYILKVQSAGYKPYSKTLVIDNNSDWVICDIDLEPITDNDFLHLNVEKIGNGRIQRQPLGNKTMENRDFYDKKSPIKNVLLTATPDDGWEFVKWSAESSGLTNTCLVNMNDNKLVVAQFRKKDRTSIQFPEKISNGNCFLSFVISNNKNKNLLTHYDLLVFIMIISFSLIAIITRNLMQSKFL